MLAIGIPGFTALYIVPVDHGGMVEDAILGKL
jgi:hypothetical protein